MAKRKTPKPKKALKVTNEELNRIQSLVNEINKIEIQVGSLEVQKHGLIHYSNDVRENMKNFQKELENKYGTSKIDINNGKINYDEQANQKDYGG